MLLTRIWAVILALLATGCLAGMFLIALSTGGEFSDSDKLAIRAVTEAGVAALVAEIDGSPVQQASGLLDDARLREALGETDGTERRRNEDPPQLDSTLAELAEQLRLRTRSDKLTLAVVDRDKAILASNGVGEALLGELITNDAYVRSPGGEATLFSIALGGELHVAWLSEGDSQGRRLVAFEPLNIGAGSLVRRVLGSKTPAGIVRKGKLLGDIIGDLSVDKEVEALAEAHREDTPDDGASKVFTVGEGLDARIGALGRVPGPAGQGRDGALLVVLSRKTAAAGQRDLAEALAQAREEGVLNQLNWVLLLGLLGVSIALAVYLPQVEAIAPMKRLTREFEAISKGQQHQIFHDRYSGSTGDLARAAATAQEAMRQQFLAELEIDDDVAEESTSTPRSGRPRTIRHRRLTRGTRRDESQARGLPQEPEPSGSGAARLPAPPPRVPTPAQLTPVKPPSGSSPKLRIGSRVPTPKSTPSANKPPSFVPPPVPGSPSALLDDSPTQANRADMDPLEEHYREVYEEFLQVKLACGETTDGLSFDRFVAKLRKNSRDLLSKRPDAAEVRFTVYVKDGKAALKAKVVKEAS